MKQDYVYTYGLLGRRRWNRIAIAFFFMLICFVALICSHFYGEYQVAQDKELLEESKNRIAYCCNSKQSIRTQLGDLEIIQYDWYPAAQIARVLIRSQFHFYEGDVKFVEGFRSGGEIKYHGQSGTEPWNVIGTLSAMLIVAMGLFIGLEFLVAVIKRYRSKKFDRW